MKKFFKLIIITLILACVIFILLKPERYVKSAFEGIKLWAVVVAPSLLPFFFFTSLLSALGLTSFISKLMEKPFKLIFRTSGAGAYAFLMSVLSGYPVGARIIADLRQNQIITKDEATRLCTLCSTSGPAFIISSVGIGMFASKKIAFAILFSHLSSAIICGLIFRFFGSAPTKSKRFISQEKHDNLLYESVYSSVVAVALVGGFICIFSLIADVAKDLSLLNPLIKPLSLFIDGNVANAFLYGLIECTRGCKALSLCNLSTYSPAFASALISFGGISIWAQSIIFLTKANANIKVFCLSKTLQAIFSFLLCLLFL